MKFISLNQVSKGMVLAMDIRDFNNKVLFEKGTVLDNEKIKIIKNNGIFRIPVNEVKNEFNVLESAYSHSTLPKDLLDIGFKQVKDIFNDLETTGKLNVEKSYAVAANITKEMEKNFSDELYIPLKKLKTYDEYLYSHSLNVMILATLIGLEENIQGQDLLNLALAGLLHDIGKTKIPLEVLNAPRKLNPDEYNFIKKHVFFTKEILENSKTIENIVINGASDHHERFDGSGYIFKKKGNEISKFGRILALADVFDALTSKRSYKEPWTPYKALSYILSHVNKDFDPKFTQDLINAFGLFPPGMEVELSNGEKGIIVASNRKNKMSPIIKTDTDTINLNKEKKLRIKKILGYVYIEDMD